MKKVTLTLFVVGVFSFGFVLEDRMTLKKIKWKALDSEESVRMEIDKRIFPKSNFEIDYAILSKEKHEYLEKQGDSIILFHSPFVPSHFLSLVSRKWMLTFHFQNKILTNYSVEKGLLGP